MVAQGQIRLTFGVDAKDRIEDLSAVCREGSWLWLAGDEQPSLERLTASADGLTYEQHRSFALSDFVDLPAGATEADIEGMDRHGDYLWLTGSHSRTRKRGKPKDDDAEVVENLGTITDHPNRHLIVRLPVVDGVDGPTPVRLTSSPTGEPITAAALVGDLTTQLREDEYVKPFVSIPSKDNGLDIEGLVALDDGHVLVGLRGPVLRGWALVIDLVLVESSQDPERLALESYLRSFLDLGGLGVRDLCRDGADVLVLAGPTMDLDGPVQIFRWKGAATSRGPVVRGDTIPCVVEEVPYGTGEDHAEGITLLGSESRDVLTVYDSPSDARKDRGSVLADRIRIDVRPGAVGGTAPPAPRA